jgi:hypothetical protein
VRFSFLQSRNIQTWISVLQHYLQLASPTFNPSKTATKFVFGFGERPNYQLRNSREERRDRGQVDVRPSGGMKDNLAVVIALAGRVGLR